MAYVLECRVVYEVEADAQDAYDQMRARAVNASVSRMGTDGFFSSFATLVHERDDKRPPDVLAQWSHDRFGIIRSGRVSTDRAPAWIQPSGSQDAYPLTDAFGAPVRVRHNGKLWQNTTAANTWEPGVYGWDELDPTTVVWGDEEEQP